MSSGKRRIILRGKQNIYDYQLSEWQKNLDELLEKGNDTDVIIECNGGEVHAHKFVLATSSAYFQKLLRNKIQNKASDRIVLPNIRKDIMQVIINFMYLKRNVLPSGKNNILEIYEAANMFELNLLITYYTPSIINNLNLNTYLNVWRVEQKYPNMKIHQAISEFLLRTLEVIVKDEQFLSFTKTELTTLIKLINENDTEAEDFLIKAILDWAKHVHGREKYLGELYKSIEQIELSWDCINSLSNNEPLISGNAEVLQTFLKCSYRNNCICQNSTNFVNPTSPTSSKLPFKITKGMTSVSDGYFTYYIGGNMEYENPQNNIEHKGSTTVIKYFPDSNTYKKLPPLLYPVFNAVLFIDNGVLYVIGRHSGNSRDLKIYVQKSKLFILLKPCNDIKYLLNSPWNVLEADNFSQIINNHNT